MRIPIDDMLAGTNPRLSKIASSLEKLVERLTQEEATEKVTKDAPVELRTGDFVWAMFQIENGNVVKCLANDTLYACNDINRGDVTSCIIFSEKLVNSNWAIDPAYRPAEMPDKLAHGTFAWAMQQFKDGKEIARREWGNDVKGWKIGDTEPFCLDEDSVAKDWEIFGTSHHDIKWAAEQLMLGKAVTRRGYEKIYHYTPGTDHLLNDADLLADDWELAE